MCCLSLALPIQFRLCLSLLCLLLCIASMLAFVTRSLCAPVAASVRSRSCSAVRLLTAFEPFFSLLCFFCSRLIIAELPNCRMWTYEMVRVCVSQPSMVTHHPHIWAASWCGIGCESYTKAKQQRREMAFVNESGKRVEKKKQKTTPTATFQLGSQITCILSKFTCKMPQLSTEPNEMWIWRDSSFDSPAFRHSSTNTYEYEGARIVRLITKVQTRKKKLNFVHFIDDKQQ